MALINFSRIKITLLSVIFIPLFTNMVWSCADGPDQYRIHNVREDDLLNVRSGPGTDFSIVGKLQYNSIGIEKLDIVPVHLCDDISVLNEFEKRNIWLKIIWRKQNQYITGWVKSLYLTGE